MSRARATVRVGDKLEGIAKLRRLPPSEAVGPLCDLLDCPHATVIEAAAKALGELGEVGEATAGEALVRAYGWADAGGKTTDPGCRARRAIVEALGTLDYRHGVPVVRRAIKTVQVEPVGGGLEDTGLGLRATAAFALAQLDRFGSLHDLALLLFDVEPNLPVPPTERMFDKAQARIAAAQALASLGETTAAALLAVKLKFPGSSFDREVSEVLAACLQSFIFLDPPNLAGIVSPYLVDENSFLASTAASALAQCKGVDALPLLEEASDAFPSDGRVALVLAITGIRSDETGRVLLRFLSERDPHVRLAAIEGAALYPSEDVLSALKRHAANDPSDHVRSAAQSALERADRS